MKIRLTLLSVLLLVYVFTTGCASFMAVAVPPKPELVDGETTTGEPVGLAYRLDTRSEFVYVLKKFPLCPELREKLKVKPEALPKGAISTFAAETPLLSVIPLMPPLGLIDAIILKAIQKQEAQTKSLGLYSTGRLLSCGEEEPAAAETIVLQFTEYDTVRYVKTDENGVLDLSTFPDIRINEIYVNLFLKKKTETGTSINYLKTVFLQ